MLRALLEDRFGLKTHKETKQMPGYSLEIDNRGTKVAAQPWRKPFRFKMAEAHVVADEGGQ